MKLKEILVYSDRKIHPHKKDHCELCGISHHKGLFVKSAENDKRELCIWCVQLNKKAHALIIQKKSTREIFYTKWGMKVQMASSPSWDISPRYKSKKSFKPIQRRLSR